jgi:hypothetical protein
MLVNVRVHSANFVNIDQIKDQCYLLVNLTPSDVFRILHIELQQQVKVALTSETSSARKELKVFTMVRM